jgi:hypothetical protein
MGQGYRWAHPADPIRTGKFVSERLAERKRAGQTDPHGRDERCLPAPSRARVAAGAATPARPRRARTPARAAT